MWMGVIEKSTLTNFDKFEVLTTPTRPVFFKVAWEEQSSVSCASRDRVFALVGHYCEPTY